MIASAGGNIKISYRRTFHKHTPSGSEKSVCLTRVNKDTVSLSQNLVLVFVLVLESKSPLVSAYGRIPCLREDKLPDCVPCRN